MTGFSAVGMAAVGGPRSTSTQAVTPAPTDTTAPTLSGSLVISAITAGGAHAAWPAASDDTGVVGYEFSCDTGVPVWVDVGNVLSLDISGKDAGAAYTARVRAYDTTGNRSSALTAPLTTAAATQPPAVGSVDVSKVPAVRIVVFEGGARVVAFAGGTRTVRF